MLLEENENRNCNCNNANNSCCQKNPTPSVSTYSFNKVNEESSVLIFSSNMSSYVLTYSLMSFNALETEESSILILSST